MQVTPGCWHATLWRCIVTLVNYQHESIDFNQRVGANVQRFRTAAGMSQAELADELTHRGYTFQQQGILKVERGSRPLKLEEAQVIAEVLRVDPESLTKQMDERLAALEQLNTADAAIANATKNASSTSTRRTGSPLKSPNMSSCGRRRPSGW